MRRKVVCMRMSEEFYNKLDELRKKFNEINGTNITLVQTGDIFARNIKPPKIQNLIKSLKKKNAGKQI